MRRHFLGDTGQKSNITTDSLFSSPALPRTKQIPERKWALSLRLPSADRTALSLITPNDLSSRGGAKCAFRLFAHFTRARAVHRAPTEKGSVEPSARRVAERTHGVRSDTVTKPNFQKGRRRELAMLLSPLVARRSNSNCDRSAHRISVLTLTLIPAAWLVLWENASPNANSPRQRCEPCKESIR